MEKKYIIALDQGTTSSRAIIFNKKGEVIHSCQKEFTQIFPESGWVEHNAAEIWDTQKEVLINVVKQSAVSADEIAAIGITNQRETTVIWDKNTSVPIHNAIVWQDRRTAKFCDELKEKGKSELFQHKTGLLLDAYFSGTKAKWILDHVEGAREEDRIADLKFGTIDSWLVYNLTAGKVHVTDQSNASRTLMYNIRTLGWDDELLEVLDVPRHILPEVKSSSEIYGYLDKEILGVEIPIAGIAGDQQSALFGQLCWDKGMAKNTYGTGCFLVMNTGDEIAKSKNNLLSSIAWSIGGKTTYALEGSIFIAGAAIQWLRDGLEIIDNAAQSEELANTVEDNGGVYFVPALSGLGAPHWDPYARGAMVGITRGTTKAHITRAALESICYQVNDVVAAMNADVGDDLKELRVDGGAVANNLLLQIQSDILDVKVVRPRTLETTAMGAAFLAGLAVGFWKNREELQDLIAIDRSFESKLGSDKRATQIKEWKKAVERSKGWID